MFSLSTRDEGLHACITQVVKVRGRQSSQSRLIRCRSGPSGPEAITAWANPSRAWSKKWRGVRLHSTQWDSAEYAQTARMPMVVLIAMCDGHFHCLARSTTHQILQAATAAAIPLSFNTHSRPLMLTSLPSLRLKIALLAKVASNCGTPLATM